MIELNNPIILEMVRNWAMGIIESRPPNEIIDRGSPYMERWMLGRKIHVPSLIGRSSVNMGPPLDPTPMPSEIENVYLHRFMRDDGEAPHCHPWPNISFVLSGCYIERTADGVAMRHPGDIVIRGASDIHAIQSVMPGTISLFLTGQKEREWGFYPDGQFVHHADYMKPIPTHFQSTEVSQS